MPRKTKLQAAKDRSTHAPVELATIAPIEGEMEAPKTKAPKKRAVTRRKKTEATAPSITTAVSGSATDLPPTIDMNTAESAPSRRSYIEAVGRRKRAVARVRLWKGGKPSFTINSKEWDQYFRPELLQMIASAPLKTVGQWERLEITCKVMGGGPVGQAEAVRHGISNVLLKLNPVFRKALKKVGYLTRDPREKERKKYGLKGARRAPQWQKR